MTEEATYTWDTIDVDESITNEDLAKADNIDVQTPVGKFLCTIVESNPIEKNFNKYSCMATKLKMRIDEIIKIEQPIIDKNGQPVKREGEVLQKVQVVTPDKAEGIKGLYAGRFIFDEVNLFNPKEKEAMKNRRLFVAKRLGIIPPGATSLTTSMWAQAPGKQVVLTTEWNIWKDKITEEKKSNVRVGWSGYDFPENQVQQQSNPTPGADQDQDEFDI